MVDDECCIGTAPVALETEAPVCRHVCFGCAVMWVDMHAELRAGMCIDICGDMSIGTCVDMCVNVSIHMCTCKLIDMCIDMRIDMCICIRKVVYVDVCIWPTASPSCYDFVAQNVLSAQHAIPVRGSSLNKHLHRQVYLIA